MSTLFPLLRLVLLCCALIALAACAQKPGATLGGADPASPLASPLPTPDPKLLVYEHTVRGDWSEGAYARVLRLEFREGDWRHFQDHVWNDILINMANPDCILLQPAADFGEPNPPPVRTMRMANRTWTVHEDVWQNSGSGWAIRYRTAPYEYTLYLRFDLARDLEAQQISCHLAVERVLDTFSIAPEASQPESDREAIKPRLWFKSAVDNAGEPIIADFATESAAWTRYDSARGGFSALMPPGWSVNEWEYRETLVSSPSSDPAKRIWISWLPLEKSSEESLLQWTEKHRGNELLLPFGAVSNVTLPIVDRSGTSEQVYGRFFTVLSGEAYLISHGNLVLSVSTYSAWVDAPALLRAVASSIEFAEDAPTTLAEIPWR